MNATRVILVRHGQAEQSGPARCYGRLDVPLAATGAEQSRSLAATLTEVPFVAVYTSPRRRAATTAAALCDGRGLAPVADGRLAELDFGAFEGRAYEEIAREHPELFRAWMTTPWTVQFPGGESWRDVRARVSDALASIRGDHQGDTVAVVAHGGVVRAALADALALRDDRIFALDVGYCRVSVVDWFGGSATVRVVNASGGDLPEVLGAR